MSPVPAIGDWHDFEVHMAHVEAVRSLDFAVGAEMGFGCTHPDAEFVKLIRAGLDNSGPRSITVAAGIEYGELLADQADVGFLARARMAFRKTRADAGE